MATITVAKTDGIDIRQIDFSDLNYGSDYSRGSVRFAVSYNDDWVDEFRGTGFTYDWEGTPTGGIVNSYAGLYRSTRMYALDGISVSAVAIANAASTPSTSDDLLIIRNALSGNDTFNGGDLADYMDGYVGNDILNGNGGNDTLLGNSGNDVLNGGAGNDWLDGGAGADNMRGGAGNDTYVVNDAGDVANESLSGSNGMDTVRSTISFSLSNTMRVFGSVENLVLLGTAPVNGTGNNLANVIAGNGAANVLAGGGGNDSLSGGAGNDTINGGVGTDAMNGGLGNDKFYVDHAGDKVFEAANQGSDAVYSAVSYALAAGQSIELLATTSQTGMGAINLAGNELGQSIHGNNGKNAINGGAGNDILHGFAGNDTINGGVGADAMNGGLGNDSFYVDNAGDRVFEVANQGIDAVYAAVSHALVAGQSVEVLATTSNTGTGAINLTGNELGQSIYGNNGKNAINGGAGSDILYGLAGNDTLTGGAGSDYFVFNTALNPSTNVDRVTDFNVAADTIRLENAVMAGLGPALGTLAKGQFMANKTGLAQEADDRIIYETDTGKLFYDANGVATGGSIHFATLAPNLLLTHADFQVI